MSYDSEYYDYFFWDNNSMTVNNNFNEQNITDQHIQQQLTSFIDNQDINDGENLASYNSQDLPILLNTPTVLSHENVSDESTIMDINSLNANNICRSPSIRSFIDNYHQNLLPILDLYQDAVYTRPTTDDTINTSAVPVLSHTLTTSDIVDDMFPLMVIPSISSTSMDCSSISTPMIGLIAEHNRPVSDFGHLDHEAIRRKCRFDLTGIKTRQKRRLKKDRMARQMYAITCRTDISKEQIMDEICRQFPEKVFQYACVSMDNAQLQTTTSTFSTIYIQIILKRVVNKHGWFLDQITGDQCNYLVTDNDMAWNEFIKKDRDFIEIGLFQSKRARSHQCTWSSSAFVRALYKSIEQT